MKKPQIHKLGNLTKDDISFPKHLTPEVVHTALFIHNAPSKEDIVKRTSSSRLISLTAFSSFKSVLSIISMTARTLAQF